MNQTVKAGPGTDTGPKIRDEVFRLFYDFL